MRAPRLLAVAAVPLLLAGCGLEKPTPLVTVVSGGSSVHTQAVRWCYEGQDPTAEAGSGDACTELEQEQQVLRVRPGEQVGVDVSKELAEGGWQVAIGPAAEAAGGTPQSQEESTGVLKDEHYFTFVPQFANGAPLRLRVQAVAGEAADPQSQPVSKGTWVFVLAPR